MPQTHRKHECHMSRDYLSNLTHISEHSPIFTPYPLRGGIYNNNNNTRNFTQRHPRPNARGCTTAVAAVAGGGKWSAAARIWQSHIQLHFTVTISDHIAVSKRPGYGRCPVSERYPRISDRADFLTGPCAISPSGQA